MNNKIVESLYIWCSRKNQWSAVAVCLHKIYVKKNKKCIKCLRKNDELKKLIKDSKNEQ